MLRVSTLLRSSLLRGSIRPAVGTHCLSAVRQLATNTNGSANDDLLNVIEDITNQTSNSTTSTTSSYAFGGSTGAGDDEAIQQVVRNSIEAFALREEPSLNELTASDEALLDATTSTDEETMTSRVTEAMRTSMRDDPLLSQLVNTIMKDGKKARAQGFVAKALLEVRSRTHSDPYALLVSAIERCSPLLRLASTRKGSKNVPVPFPLNERQRRRYAITWILKAAEKRSERQFPMRLASELIAVSQGQSSAIDHRQRVHKEALAARANVQAGTQHRSSF
ncbi:ribosomal protein S7 domain-containing protein [Syncephalis plumigaleata]|nr:ribosomal protein S7 domain-containing protein [Syncephalis plumigaleata]